MRTSRTSATKGNQNIGVEHGVLGKSLECKIRTNKPVAGHLRNDGVRDMLLSIRAQLCGYARFY